MPRNSSGSRKRRLREIQSRGRKCRFFAAAPGLYFKAFLSGLGEAPATNPELRAELEAASLEALLRELRERDPAAYEKIDKQNPRRVIRAVEVIRLTGKKFSEQRAEWKVTKSRSPESQNTLFFCFTRRRRICTRASTPAWMRCSRAGWWRRRAHCSSTASPKTKRRCRPSATGRSWSICAANAHWTETIELVKSRTRQFAKRQLTWFRRHGNMEWIELKPEEPLEECARKIAVIFSNCQHQ